MTTLEAVASGANQNIDPLQPGTLPWVEIHQDALTLSRHCFNLTTERISGTSRVLARVFSRIHGLEYFEFTGFSLSTAPAMCIGLLHPFSVPLSTS